MSFNSHFGLCSSHSRALNGKTLDVGKNTRVLDPLLRSALTEWMSGQAPASLQHPDGGQESPGAGSASDSCLHSLCDWGGPPFALQSSSQGRLNSDHNKNKDFPSIPLHSLGTFYATSIHWNICTASYFCKPNNIFKHAGGGDFTEEVCVESFCKRKIVLLFKQSFFYLIVSKMPGFLTYAGQRKNMWHKFIDPSNSRWQIIHRCHNSSQGIPAHLTLVTPGIRNIKLEPMT